MYREIIYPTENSFTIQLPDSYIGKSVEVIAFAEDEAIGNSQNSRLEKTFEEFMSFYDRFKTDLNGWKFDRNEANDYDRGRS